QGPAEECSPGGFDERDDLIFAVTGGGIIPDGGADGGDADSGGGGDMTPPTAVITAPTGGATLPGTFAVNVSAMDDVGVTKVELLVDGVLNATDTMPPYSFNVTQ